MRKEIRDKIDEAKIKNANFDGRRKRVFQNDLYTTKAEFKKQLIRDLQAKPILNKKPKSQQIIDDWKIKAEAEGKNPAYMPMDIVEQWFEANKFDRDEYLRRNKNNAQIKSH